MIKSPRIDEMISVRPLEDLTAIEQQVQVQFLEALSRAGVVEIKRYIDAGFFKKSSRRLRESIQGRVEGNSVVWFSDLPYAKVQEKGMKARQMIELKDKVIPVTVYKYGGQLKVYRRASLKAIMSGKFFHPGFPGKGFFERGIRIAMSQVPQLWADARRAVMMVLPNY